MTAVQIDDLSLVARREDHALAESIATLWVDQAGLAQLIVPYPAWEDFLRLAFDEIASYGAQSVQVMRRMKALVNDLTSRLPRDRHAALHYWENRLQSIIARSFEDMEEKEDASVEDRQGLGVLRKR